MSSFFDKRNTRGSFAENMSPGIKPFGSPGLRPKVKNTGLAV
jgi:hypothetical protein